MSPAPDEPGAEARRIEIERLERLARTMDSAFGIPGTRLRIGLDGIIGLIPGIGDTLALAPALYIVAKGAQLGVPGPTLGRMGVNVAVDAAIGAIPLVGDLFDVGFKANRRNVALIRQHVAPGLEAAAPDDPYPTISRSEKK